MPHIVLDFDPPQPDAPTFETPTSGLVYFLSWAYSARYGASHEMSVAALLLRGQFRIDLLPLLTFADRKVEDPDDLDSLEQAWQDPAPLADCCEKTAAALVSGEKRLDALREESPQLRNNIAELGSIARWAAGRGSRIRITFLMEDDA